MSRRGICIGWILVASLGSLPAVAAPATLEKQLAAGDHKGFVQVVKLSYRLLGEYARNADSDLRFTLSAFRTYSARELSVLSYGDIATPTEGWVISIVRHSRTDEAKGRRSIAFEPRWTMADTNETSTTFAARSLPSVLADIEQDRPGMAAQLQAITTYRVRVEMAGKVRTYRAAYLWAADSDAGDWKNLRILPLDGVTRGLDHAVAEPLPPEGRFLPRPHLDLERATVQATATCDPSTTREDPPSRLKFGHDRHYNGYHRGEFGTSFICECSSSCTSTCSPHGWYTQCTDTGATTTGFHVTDQAYDDSVGVRQMATSEGAQCASAYICGVKQCSFPGCAFSVSVTVQGTSASFGTGGGFWSFQSTFDSACAPCQETPAGGDNDDEPGYPDQQDPWGGGGGGGGGGDFPVCTLVCVGGDLVPPECEYRCW